MEDFLKVDQEPCGLFAQVHCRAERRDRLERALRYPLSQAAGLWGSSTILTLCAFAESRVEALPVSGKCLTQLQFSALASPGKVLKQVILVISHYQARANFVGTRHTLEALSETAR